MPGVQYMYLDSLEQLKSEEFWVAQLRQLRERIVMNPKFWYETRKIGASCTPIETSSGWVQIYHGVENTPGGTVYRASAVLLDLNDPAKIGRLYEPLFSPIWIGKKKAERTMWSFPQQPLFTTMSFIFITERLTNVLPPPRSAYLNW